MLRVCVGPTSQKTVTHELMAACAALAREHPGVRLHTHLAENQVCALSLGTAAEVQWSQDRHIGCKPCSQLDAGS